MTFYQIDLSPIEEWLQGAVMRELQHRIDSGVLVPVEPDITALAKLLSCHLTPTWEELVKLGEHHDYIEEATELWATGIGDNDGR